MRRAKIIGTLGPSSCEVNQIRPLIEAGLDIARVNISNGTHESHSKLIDNIRQASIEANKEVRILIDLQGPKIRVHKLDEPLQLVTGEEWVIGSSKLKSKYTKIKNYIPNLGQIDISPVILLLGLWFIKLCMQLYLQPLVF